MKKTSNNLFFSCEHGGNKVPLPYLPLFKGGASVLKTHRGLDIGALQVAKDLRRSLKSPLLYSEITRLLMDLNRPVNSNTLFSEFTKDLNAKEKQKLFDSHYHPYHKKFKNFAKSNSTIHIGVHSFTPVFKGKVRSVDIGVLFDPKRPGEVKLAELWVKELKKAYPHFLIKKNHPYRGSSEGIATELRQKCSDKKFLSLELEINQKWLLKFTTEKQGKPFTQALAKTLKRALQNFKN